MKGEGADARIRGNRVGEDVTMARRGRKRSIRTRDHLDVGEWGSLGYQRHVRGNQQGTERTARGASVAPKRTVHFDRDWDGDDSPH